MKKINYLNIIYFVLFVIIFFFSFFKEDIFGNVILKFSISSYIKLFNFSFLKKFVNNFLIIVILSFALLILSIIYVFIVLNKKRRKQIKYIIIPLILLIFNFFAIVFGLNNLFVNKMLTLIFSYICISLPIGIIICYLFFKNISFDSYYTSLNLTNNSIKAFNNTILKKYRKKFYKIFLILINILFYIYLVSNFLLNDSFVISFISKDIHLPFLCTLAFLFQLMFRYLWRFTNEKDC